MARTLGLVAASWREGVLTCAGDVSGLRVALEVGVARAGLPVRVRVGDREDRGARFLFLPTWAALGLAAAPTGDRAFDREVAVVIGAPVALTWLDAPARVAVREAAKLGASLSDEGAALEPEQALAFESAPEALAAIDVLAAAVHRLREAAHGSLVERYGVDDGAPEVTRAVVEHVDATLQRLPDLELARFARIALRRSEEPERVLAPLIGRRPVQEVLLAHRPWSPLLVEEARRTWPAGDPWLAAALFRARLALGDVDELHGLPGFATLLDDEELEGAVLDADGARPGSVDDLLVQLEPSSPANLDRLLTALARSPHPRVERRLKKLLPRDPQRVARLLADRVLAAIDGGRERDLEDLTDTLWVEPVLEALLALPDRAASFLVTLRPEADHQQVRLAARLGRCAHPAVERRLVGLLEFGTLPVRRAAAAALGESGGGAALTELEALVAGWLVDPELRAAARASAARIRERHAAGGLSVVTSGGELSLPVTRGADGALSLRKKGSE